MQFKEEFAQINNAIKEFNQFLSLNCQVPFFDLETGFETNDIVKITHGDWGGWHFPNNQTRGVYFLFGIKENENGIYIGKASNSWTSDRIWKHMTPYRNEPQYLKDGYVIDYVASINLDKLNIHFMATSLEEFLILRLKDVLKLINVIGNK